MTFTFSEKQIGDSSTSASTIAAGALTNAVTTSQFVVGAVVWSDDGTGGPTLSNVKDEASNTYTLVGSTVESTATGTFVRLFYLDAPPGSPKTLTATLSGATMFRNIYVGVFNRGAAVTLDKNSTNTGSGTAISVASFTPTGANELIFSACADDAGTSLTAGTNGGNYTILEQGLSAAIGGSEYLIQMAATPTTANFTTTGSSTWAEAAAAFKEGSVTPPAFVPRPRRYQTSIIPVQLWKR